MSKFLAFAGILLALTAGPASAGTSMIQLSGFSFETGGFPTSTFGEELTAVGTVTHIKKPLYWSPTRYSYTWCADGMMSLGETVVGSTHVVEYSGGTLRIHVDALPSNAAYGTFPPNATSPSTFMDGHGVYLEGTLSSLMLIMNTDTGAGSVIGSLTFFGGNAFPQLQNPDGWTVGAQLLGTGPAGYDCDWNATLFVEGPLGVAGQTWSGIKAMYR